MSIPSEPHRVDITHYTYHVTWSADDAEFVATCLEFPSLSWLADTQDNALSGLRDLVGDIVDNLRRSHEPVPGPRSSRTSNEPVEFVADLADLMGSPHHSFTRLEMRGMVECARILVLRDATGRQIGLATVTEDRMTGHFSLRGRIDDQNAAELVRGTSLGYSCDSPLHGPQDGM